GWYVRYLNREPDPGGYQAFVQRVRRGEAADQLQAEILGSEEFFNNQGRDPAAFIAGLYRVVLGTGANPGDVATWGNRLAQLRGHRVQLPRDCLRTPPRPVGPPPARPG